MTLAYPLCIELRDDKPFICRDVLNDSTISKRCWSDLRCKLEKKSVNKLIDEWKEGVVEQPDEFALPAHTFDQDQTGLSALAHK